MANPTRCHLWHNSTSRRGKSEERLVAILACVGFGSALTVFTMAFEQVPSCGAPTVPTNPVKGQLLRDYVVYEDGSCGVGYYRHYVYQYVATDTCNNGHKVRHYTEREEVQFQGY